jgi:hypothetical protein
MILDRHHRQRQMDNFLPILNMHHRHHQLIPANQYSRLVARLVIKVQQLYLTFNQ